MKFNVFCTLHFIATYLLSPYCIENLRIFCLYYKKANFYFQSGKQVQSQDYFVVMDQIDFSFFFLSFLRFMVVLSQFFIPLFYCLTGFSQQVETFSQVAFEARVIFLAWLDSIWLKIYLFNSSHLAVHILFLHYLVLSRNTFQF